MRRNLLRTFAVALSFTSLLASPALAYVSPTPPTVGAVTPTSATVGVNVTLSSSFSSSSGVTYCEIDEGPAILSSGSFSSETSGDYTVNYTFTIAGNHSLQTRCQTFEGVWGSGPLTVITVSSPPDVTPPTVSAVSPTSATSGWSNTFSATYSDSGSGVVQCRLNIDGSIIWTQPPFAPVASGTVSLDEGSELPGPHYFQYQCRDAAGNWGYGTQTQVTFAPRPDTFPPSVGNIFDSIDQPNAGATVWYYVNATDDTGVASCHLLLDGSDVGAMSLQSSGSYGVEYTWPATAADVGHTAQARCSDAAGNSALSSNVLHFTVFGNPPPVSTAIIPTVGPLAPTAAIAGLSTPITASVSNASYCSLYVNNAKVANMPIANGMASTNYVFSTGPVPSVHVECGSADGHIVSDLNVAISVVAGSQSTLTHGTLIKLACPAGATGDDPCTAVYYFGSDGKRHPFPNARVFFTWYTDFNGVVVVTSAQMAAIPLGGAVLYRPGVRMVKFTTLNKVYTVSTDGLLRWVTTEALAKAFYTDAWNKQIDDLPDTEYGNYHFGSDITDVSQYNPVGETNMASSIDTNQ